MGNCCTGEDKDRQHYKSHHMLHYRVLLRSVDKSLDCPPEATHHIVVVERAPRPQEVPKSSLRRATPSERSPAQPHASKASPLAQGVTQGSPTSRGNFPAVTAASPSPNQSTEPYDEDLLRQASIRTPPPSNSPQQNGAPSGERDVITSEALDFGSGSMTQPRADSSADSPQAATLGCTPFQLAPHDLTCAPETFKASLSPLPPPGSTTGARRVKFPAEVLTVPVEDLRHSPLAKTRRPARVPTRPATSPGQTPLTRTGDGGAVRNESPSFSTAYAAPDRSPSSTNDSFNFAGGTPYTPSVFPPF
jgi:hypothetical protein